MQLTRQEIKDFQSIVWNYFTENGRDLPWRTPVLPLQIGGMLDAYAIMVSEIMLQQTQVARVIPKYQAFMARFPTVSKLAAADLAAVLQLWSGLGYNRRAKYLWEAAQAIVKRFDSKLPNDQKALTSLPGIGKNTAAAIMAYAFDMPVVFVETNIRTVYIHHFFTDQTNIADSALLPLIESTLPQEGYRQWYWALMDYGSYLKSTVGNLSRESKHYTRQSAFIGSKRQVRGAIIRQLTAGPATREELARHIADERLDDMLDVLKTEKLIRQSGVRYFL